MPRFFCPNDCILKNQCQFKTPLPGDKFTNNPTDEICWCYAKPLPKLKDSRKIIKR
jgi:hypothetical protein